jgi:signal transduction histidine kinase/phage shock protein PspC (stress-responsive transcriptional regulator)
MVRIIRIRLPRRHRGSPRCDPDVTPSSPGTARIVSHGGARDHRSVHHAPTSHRSHHPITRRSEHRLVAGVASGLGDHFHVEPNLVRLAFVVLAFAGGAGIVLYAAGWLFLPTDDERASVDDDEPSRTRNDLVQVAALGTVTLGVLLLARSIGLGFSDGLLWPIVLAAMGTALIIGRSGRPIDELIGELVRRERGLPARAGAGTPETAAVLRIVLGGALVVAGVGAFLATQGTFRAVGQGLLAVAVMLGGLGLIFGPWLWRLWTALVEERRERIRSDERAEMAAHLHDSVLQTLALIQRRADDPRAVVGLARSQERELRTWLFGRAPARADLDLGDALEAVASDVEHTHGVPIETVRVGGACALDDRLRALVAATQEAMVNATRHSGARSVAVYEEVAPEQVTVFVRDRGCGFDPGGIANDRGGIAESIRGRMQRNGGVAVIRSRPGHGTEVELSMPRAST